ncbi:hypothetical protein AMTR_s00009p00101700, partial [Amborella trichopoda]
DGGWLPKFPCHCASGGWASRAKSRPHFISGVRFKGGHGDRVKFWKDLWLGNQNLVDRFPTMFSIAANRDTLVSGSADFKGNHLVWAPVFTRAFKEVEGAHLAVLLELLHGFYLT